MKNILKLIILLLFLQCNTTTDNTVSLEDLQNKHQDIVNYIKNFDCTQATACSAIGIGVKPCGGPAGYLPYPNNIDMVAFKKMINDYNTLTVKYNSQTGAMSDCSVETPPIDVQCINGVCTIIR